MAGRALVAVTQRKRGLSEPPFTERIGEIWR